MSYSEALMVQVIAVLGALAILVAYAANQFRLMGPSNLSYTLLNLTSQAPRHLPLSAEEGLSRRGAGHVR